MLALTLIIPKYQMPSRITLADVAQAAGVSLMTVSRVVNQKEGVSEATRHQVVEWIEQLGYRPSSIARSLVTRRTGTLGLIVPDIANPYFSGIAHGVAEIAYAQGFSVLLCDAEENPQREYNLLQVLEEKQVDGVLMAAPRLSSDDLLPALQRHDNVVILNRLFKIDKNTIGCVLNDDKVGGRIVTQFLIERGHNHIGFLSGPVISYGSKQRVQGFKAATKQANLPFQAEMVQSCPPTVVGGKEAARRFLQQHPEVTGLLCFNDMVAIGALQASLEVGRRIPQDLAIVGYDDIPMAALVTPALTTCRVSFEEMGRLATQLLIDHLNNCQEGCKNIVLTPELIIRASAI
jgi:LacI family transcriptional regulator